MRCIHRNGKEEEMGAKKFLDVVVGEYLKRIDLEEDRAKRVMRKLLKAEEKDNSNERCWNWRNKELGVEKTLKNRGNRYNGYPVSPGYFGSYSMDGLALALHVFYHTTSFNEAIVYVVNMFEIFLSFFSLFLLFFFSVSLSSPLSLFPLSPPISPSPSGVEMQILQGQSSAKSQGHFMGGKKGGLKKHGWRM